MGEQNDTRSSFSDEICETICLCVSVCMCVHAHVRDYLNCNIISLTTAANIG